MAVVRHMYILCKGLIYQSNACIIFNSTFMTAFITALIPAMTLFHEPHPLCNTCLLIVAPDKPPDYAFLLAFFIILANSLLVDVICYARILNFMRKNNVRVTVIANSESLLERHKSYNIVTATSSFLIWMVNLVFMIPSTILMIRSGPGINAQHIFTLIVFQQVSVMAFTVLNPLLYMASSSTLRKDVSLCKRHLLRHALTQDLTDDQHLNINANARSEVYAIQLAMEPPRV